MADWCVPTGSMRCRLRALANAVDMEPQSLYTYFASKHAVYDRLFADANHELLARLERIDISDDQSERLRRMARCFVFFAAEDQARYELLFQRTIPDFEPSPGPTPSPLPYSTRDVLCSAVQGSPTTPTSTSGPPWSPAWRASNSPTTPVVTGTSDSLTKPSRCSPTTSSPTTSPESRRTHQARGGRRRWCDSVTQSLYEAIRVGHGDRQCGVALATEG